MKKRSGRLIKIRGRNIWLTPKFKLNIEETNLPTSLGFRDESENYWKIDFLQFDANQKILEVSVVDFYPSNTDSFHDQKMKSNIVKLNFKKLEWRYLEPFLAYYKKQELADLIIDSELAYVPDLSEKVLDFSVKVALKDLTYQLGYVSFNTYVEQINQEIEVRVSNVNVVPEFDLIKSFFSKKLKRKYTDAEVTIKLKGSRVVEVMAHSAAIEKIDSRFIDTIKYNRTIALSKKPLVVAIDKSLFTADEVFDSFSEKHTGNVFNQNALDIIQVLSAQGAVRNRKQLQYLSGLKQDHQYKIHITLKPVFGFLFLIEGHRMYHFCWELLNSHATYLWSFEKRSDFIPHAFQKLEKTIQTIREQGRERYKQAYRQGQVDDELDFQVIVHRQSGSQLIDPFPRWRQQLEEKLV